MLYSWFCVFFCAGCFLGDLSPEIPSSLPRVLAIIPLHKEIQGESYRPLLKIIFLSRRKTDQSYVSLNYFAMYAVDASLHDLCVYVFLKLQMHVIGSSLQA